MRPAHDDPDHDDDHDDDHDHDHDDHDDDDDDRPAPAGGGFFRRHPNVGIALLVFGPLLALILFQTQC